MRKVKTTSGILLVIASLLVLSSCDQSTKETDKKAQIKNTIKSVTLFQDSIGIEPIQLLADLERINNAIDSIGYPDAGYKLWEVISDDTLEFRFMVEGYWPDKETYETIHDHELYQNETKIENATWSGLKSTWYYRFKRIDE